MNSEKVKEIKKALEYAIQVGLDKFSLGASLSDCLTLINELESENERLVEQRNKTYNIWVKDTEKLKDRIAELESNYQNVCVLLTAKNEQLCDLTKENQQLKNRIATLERKLDAKESYYNAVKDRALEVFAQKIKENLDISVVGYSTEEVVNSVNNTIDETLKELKK